MTAYGLADVVMDKVGTGWIVDCELHIYVYLVVVCALITQGHTAPHLPCRIIVVRGNKFSRHVRYDRRRSVFLAQTSELHRSLPQQSRDAILALQELFVAYQGHGLAPRI